MITHFIIVSNTGYCHIQITNCLSISADIDVGALVTVCTLAITLLLVYGAIKGKATHLLPFFCMQLFDFAITT